MNRLRIYRISDHYIRFLRSRDDKVQYNKNHHRPYVGIVLIVSGFRYFVPMESPKPDHTDIKPGTHILKLDNGRMGLLGFNNMIPVPETALIEFDIKAEPDEKYRNLLLRQASLCNKLKSDIMDRAHRTYFDVVNNKNKFLVGISCNFRTLEKACNQYNPQHQKKKPVTATAK